MSEELDLNMDENDLYISLVKDIYDKLETNNLFYNNEIKVPKPNTKFNVTKKTIWYNFRETCENLKINEQQLVDFISNELSTNMSINSEGCLLIKGRYSDIKIGSILKKYIVTFLQCSTCHSINTKIEKKPNKLTYLICNNDKCKCEKVLKYN